MNDMRKLMETLADIEEAGGIGDELKRKISGKVSGMDHVHRMAVSAISDAITRFEMLEIELYDRPESVREVSREGLIDLRKAAKELRTVMGGK